MLVVANNICSLWQLPMQLPANVFCAEDPFNDIHCWHATLRRHSAHIASSACSEKTTTLLLPVSATASPPPGSRQHPTGLGHGHGHVYFLLPRPPRDALLVVRPPPLVRVGGAERAIDRHRRAYPRAVDCQICCTPLSFWGVSMRMERAGARRIGRCCPGLVVPLMNWPLLCRAVSKIVTSPALFRPAPPAAAAIFRACAALPMKSSSSRYTFRSSTFSGLPVVGALIENFVPRRLVADLAPLEKNVRPFLSAAPETHSRLRGEIDGAYIVNAANMDCPPKT